MKIVRDVMLLVGVAVAACGGASIAARADTWQATKGYTNVIVSWDNLGVSRQSAKFGDVEATLDFTPTDPDQARVDVRAPGAEHGFHALAAFGHDRSAPGDPFVALTPPDVPHPWDQPSFRDGPPPEVDWPSGPQFPFWTEAIEGRPALGHAPWDPTPRTDAENGSWMRFEHPPRTDDGAFDELAGACLEVQPYDLLQTASALHTALTMEPAERATRATTVRSRIGARRPVDWLGDQLTHAR